jgi:hypothetical protein
MLLFRPSKFLNTSLLLALALFFVQCKNKRPLEKVVLKDKTEWSGEIVKVDSVQVALKISRSEKKVFDWKDIQRVENVAQRSWVFGYQLGYGHIPYYSMFRGESMSANGIGFQCKLGKTKNGNSIRYFHFAQNTGIPFSVRKWGWGFQRYLLGDDQARQGLYAGSDVGWMKPQFNNGNQFYLEPFVGYDGQWSKRLRTFAKVGMQWNVLNQNPAIGVSISIGLNFLLQDWDHHYEILNTQHRRWYK